MAQARREEMWGHTSSVMALIANANRDRKRQPRPYEPSDFNPLVTRKGERVRTKEEVKARVKAFRDSWIPASKRKATPK